MGSTLFMRKGSMMVVMGMVWGQGNGELFGKQKQCHIARRRRNQKAKPLHHGGAETRRKQKINGFFSNLRSFCGFIQSVDISRLCLHQRDKGTERTSQNR